MNTTISSSPIAPAKRACFRAVLPSVAPMAFWLTGSRVERQGACLQHQSQLLGVLQGEGARDLGATAGDLFSHRRRRLHLAVKHYGQLLRDAARDCRSRPTLW